LGLNHLYAAFILLISFTVYLKTLSPTVSFFDSGELITAAYSLGVAHPPGYPLYTLVSWIFTFLPLGNIAYRVNLASACFASLTVTLVYYILLHLLHHEIIRYGSRGVEEYGEGLVCPVISLFGALAFAFSPTLWAQAVRAEVYSLNAFFVALLLWISLKWKSQSPQDRQKWLYRFALAYGLGFGNHQTLLLLLPGFVFLFLGVDRRIVLNRKNLARMMVFLGLGLSIYLLIPIRAAQHPPINWGDAHSLRQFIWLVTREGYKHVEHGRGLTLLWEDLQRRPGGIGWVEGVAQSLFLQQLNSFNLVREFSWPGLILGLTGLFFLALKNKVVGLATLISLISLSLGVVVIGDPIEANIFLLEEFHTPSYLIFSLWLGAGVSFWARSFLSLWRFPSYRSFRYQVAVILLAFGFFLLPAYQLIHHAIEVDRSRDFIAYDYGKNILIGLQPQALLFTWGDSGAFPLWYLQIVEKLREDVVLVHLPQVNSPWYMRPLVKPLRITSNLWGGSQVDPSSILTDLIQQNLPYRPIYFDFSSRYYLSNFAPEDLLPYGLVFKLARPGEVPPTDLWDRYQYREIIEKRVPQDLDVWHAISIYGQSRIELGKYYVSTGQTDRALEEFQMALRFDPTLAVEIGETLK